MPRPARPAGGLPRIPEKARLPARQGVPQARIDAMRAHGHWRDEVMGDYLDRCRADVPDKTAVVDFNCERGRETRLSYRELAARVDRIALGLGDLGVEKYDVVSCQLPNWWEFSALVLACMRIGAVVNPVMPIFRERELEFMLGFAETKLFVVPRKFRGFDHAAMARAIRAGLPRLERRRARAGSPRAGRRPTT